MTDDELTGYAWHHCRTDRALFHAQHIRRLLSLAGWPIPKWLVGSDGWYAVPEDQMTPVLKDIEKMKTLVNPPTLTLIRGGKQ